MNRMLQWINLVGVATLAAACALQWGRLRAADAENRRLDDIRLRQAGRIDEQAAQLAENAADLDAFRKRISSDEAALKTAAASIQAEQQKSARLLAERDRVAADLSSWKAAVAERDAAITLLNQLVQKTAGERDRAIGRSNATTQSTQAVK